MITYDKDGNKVPSKEFLSMVIILLRKCEVETETSFLKFLESFNQSDDKLLLKEVHKMLKDNYLEGEN